MSILCSLVGASFTVAAVAQVLRSKKGITAVGNAQVDTAQSKFGGASAYFDGSDDQLIAIGDFSQAGNCTFEFWFRPNRVTGLQILMAIGNENPERAAIYLDGTALKYDTYGGGGTPKFTCSGTYSSSTWYHLAVVRSGTTVTVYIDGTSVGTATKSETLGNANNIHFGSITADANDYQGWIDEMRVSNTARYTTTFTPSTTPFVNDANTVLLIHANGTDGSTFFEDDNGVRSQLGITAVGNAQVDTAQSQFGGASALFDGTNDYLTVSDNNTLSLGTGDYTVECWIRPTSVGSQSRAIFDFDVGANSSNPILYISASSKIAVYNVPMGGVEGPTNVTTNTWHHIVLSRSSGETKVALNGVWQLARSNSYTISNASFRSIGAATNAGDDFVGHIDEIRISSVARYNHASNFTPSTTAFVNDANTLLLLHMNQADAATIFQDDNTGTVTTEDSYTVPTAAFASDALTVALYHFDNNGTDSGPNGYTLNTTGGYSSSVVKFGTHSGHLADSTSDYFGHTTDRQWSPYDGSVLTNWTVEGWFYYTSWTGASQDFNGTPLPNAIWIGDIGANRLPILFGFTGAAHSPAGRLTMTAARVDGEIRGVVVTSTTTYNLNTWHHIALTYNSTTGIFKGYVNGEKAFTSSTPSCNLFTLPTHLTIGAGNGANSECYVDEVRISRMIRYGI